MLTKDGHQTEMASSHESVSPSVRRHFNAYVRTSCPDYKQSSVLTPITDNANGWHHDLTGRDSGQGRQICG